MDTDDAANFREFVETIVREQRENMTWDPVHWRTCLAVIAATLLPDKSTAEYLTSQGADLSTKVLLSVVKRGNVRLLRLTIGTLRKFHCWTPDDWHCGIALVEAWPDKDMYNTLVANGAVFRPGWLEPAVQCNDPGTIITLIHGLKSIGHWKPAGTEVQQALEESINRKQNVCFYCLLSAGAIAATRLMLPAVRSGNHDIARELVRNLKAWNRTTWMVDKHVIQALEETCSDGDMAGYSFLIAEGVEPTYSCLLSAMRLGDIDIGSRVLSDLKRLGRYRSTTEATSYLGKINAILNGLPREKRTVWLNVIRERNVHIFSCIETTGKRYSDALVRDGPLVVPDTTFKAKSPKMVKFATQDIVDKYMAPGINSSSVLERDNAIKTSIDEMRSLDEIISRSIETFRDQMTTTVDDVAWIKEQRSLDDVAWREERRSLDDVASREERRSLDEMTALNMETLRAQMTATVDDVALREERRSLDEVAWREERRSLDDVASREERRSLDEMTALNMETLRAQMTATVDDVALREERRSLDEVAWREERRSLDDVASREERRSLDEMTATLMETLRAQMTATVDDVALREERRLLDDVKSREERRSKDENTGDNRGEGSSGHEETSLKITKTGYVLAAADLAKLLLEEEQRDTFYDESITEDDNTTNMKQRSRTSEDDIGISATVSDRQNQCTEVTQRSIDEDRYSRYRIADSFTDASNKLTGYTSRYDDPVNKHWDIKPKITIARPQNDEDEGVHCALGQTVWNDDDDTYYRVRRELRAIFQPRNTLPLVKISYRLDDTHLWNDNPECKGAETHDMFYLKRRFLSRMRSNTLREKYRDHLNTLQHM